MGVLCFNRSSCDTMAPSFLQNFHNLAILSVPRFHNQPWSPTNSSVLIDRCPSRALSTSHKTTHEIKILQISRCVLLTALTTTLRQPSCPPLSSTDVHHDFDTSTPISRSVVLKHLVASFRHSPEARTTAVDPDFVPGPSRSSRFFFLHII